MITIEERLDGSKLIAEFLDKKEAIERTYLLGGGGFMSCRWHDSWDWSMPVASKINAMGKEYNLSIFKTYISLSVEKPSKFTRDFSFSHAEYITSEQSGKEALFRLIIKFLKWYNEKKAEKDLVD